VKLKNKENTKVRGALRTIEYEDKGCICEPEHGQILGEDEGENEGIDEIQESHIFKSDKLFMNAGFAGVKNEEQLSKTVTKIEGDRNMFSKPTKEEHGQNLVTRKSETVLSTAENKHEELNAMAEGKNLNSVLEEKEIVEFHIHTHAQLNGRDSFQSTMRDEKKEEIKYSKYMFEKVEEKTIEYFLNLIEDLEQQKKELMIESSSKTIESYEINANNLSVYAGCATDNPFLGVVSSKTEVCPAGHHEGEHVKHKNAVLEEAEREILLLENLLKKSESNWKLGLQVEELCFNNLDEEMKYFEEHIGNDEGIKDSVGVFPSSKHENDMAEKYIF
jgi:hypothetical protein